MLKYFIPTFCACFFFSFSSCKSQSTAEGKNIKSFEQFPAEKDVVTKQYLQLNDIDPDKLSLYDELYLYNDSLLFLANLAGANAHHFVVYNIQKKKFVQRFLPHGGKKGSSLGFMSFGIRGNKFWVNDIMKRKIIVNNLDSLLVENYSEVSEFPMPVFYYSSQLINDSILLASGDYNSDYKIVKRNILNGIIEEEMYAYHSDSSRLWDMVQKTAYESFLYLNSAGDKCALAARYSDRLEIFDMTKQSSLILKGPESFEPGLRKVVDNNGNKISTTSPNTKLAFTRGHVTKKYIYLLYSGNKDLTGDRDYGKHIYVYDWEGNPIKKLNFENYIGDFIITSDDSKIYTYKPGLPFIYSSNL